MNVSDAVKEQYKNNSIHKNLILSFPELTTLPLKKQAGAIRICL